MSGQYGLVQCRTCNGTGIGWGRVSAGWLETDCSDCAGSGQVLWQPTLSTEGMTPAAWVMSTVIALVGAVGAALVLAVALGWLVSK